MKPRVFAITFFVILLVISLPYVAAARMGGKEYIFIGFLLNPIDGLSYLAKMYQGWTGAWRFVLPYTAEAGQGAYIYLFYLFLGHFARWTGISLIVMYHLARLVGAGFLLVGLSRLSYRVFPGRVDLSWRAFLLSSCGAGLGWMVIFFGKIPFDLWVAEAYPFLSMYSSPHFSIGLALVLFSLDLLSAGPGWKSNMLLSMIGLAIAIIYPFGLVVNLLLSCGWMIWTWIDTHQLPWKPVVSSAILGGPVLLYQYLVMLTDPVLSGWNAQNITLTPSGVDVFLALSPALLLAFVGWIWLLGQKERPVRRVLLLWPVLAFGLMYFSFSLQRRFSLGIFIPLAFLAIMGGEVILEKSKKWGKWVNQLLFVLSLPTYLLMIVSGIVLAGNHPRLLYLAQNEYEALNWIGTDLSKDAVILASPEMSLMIPAFTGRRVIYAHPFETVNALQEEEQVLKFYSGTGWTEGNQAYLQEKHIDFFFYGPRERELGGKLDTSQFNISFQSGDVYLFDTSDRR